MPILKIERASVVITPEGKELHLLTCVVCNVKFYGRENQQRCDACGKARLQSQKSGRSRSKRASA
jgi:DNA-directed RNA polymerase beta' subunit